MKRFITWIAVGLLVAVAISRWRRMNEPGHQAPREGTERPAADPGPANPPVGGAGAATRRTDEPKSGVEATPSARRRADELGVDLSMVKGTGAGGRITVKDVQSAAKERRS